MVKEFDIGQRIQALTLHSEGFSRKDILAKTGYSNAGFGHLLQKATKRGYQRGGVILRQYVDNGETRGRKPLLTTLQKDRIVEILTNNKTSRKFSTQELADKFNKNTDDQNVSRKTVLRHIRSKGFKNVKPTTKAGVNKQNKAERLKFCLAVKDWQLDQWKLVVWSDETSVVLNAPRGSVKVWRRSHEAEVESVTRQRWKGFKDFMFWGCFCWYEMGPHYTWPKETAAMKSKYTKMINEYNKKAEPEAKAKWELETSMARLGLKNKPGRKPTWSFTAKRGAQMRDPKRKGGIDWIRYREEILKPRFVPFVKKLQEKYPGLAFIAQEDNAPPHASQWCRQLWKETGIQMIEWPANSPDLSAIEQAWFVLKAHTSEVNKAKNSAEMHTAWGKAFSAYPEKKRHRLVDRIRGHIWWTIYLIGGNGYKQGTWPPNSLKNEEPSEALKAEWVRKAEDWLQQHDAEPLKHPMVLRNGGEVVEVEAAEDAEAEEEEDRGFSD